MEKLFKIAVLIFIVVWGYNYLVEHGIINPQGNDNVNVYSYPTPLPPTQQNWVILPQAGTEVPAWTPFYVMPTNPPVVVENTPVPTNTVYGPPVPPGYDMTLTSFYAPPDHVRSTAVPSGDTGSHDTGR